MIDWKSITNHYNLTHKTRFSTAEMLEHIYRNIGSVWKVADYLGVSTYALIRKMDLLNVPRMRKTPWPESLISKLAGIPTARLAKMTVKEISKELHCYPASVYRALDSDGREYKRVKPQHERS